MNKNSIQSHRKPTNQNCQAKQESRAIAPVITLTTDFGTRDGYVGAMKGKILSICPQATIIDITHEIQPQNILQCSWCLLRSAPPFPARTIHVAVVDPGVGSARRPILIKSDNRWYIGPDNGVFSEIIRQLGTEEIYDIKPETEWWQAHTSFDGLALFAPVAGHLACGLSPLQFCTPIERLLTILPKSIPTIEPQAIRGRILMFDRFGNALTDIGKHHLTSLQKPSCFVSCQKHSFRLVTHYEQGRNDPVIALINSDGYLELAVYGSSAEKSLGLRSGDPVTVR
jgi:hypothetical protein